MDLMIYKNTTNGGNIYYTINHYNTTKYSTFDEAKIALDKIKSELVQKQELVHFESI